MNERFSRIGPRFYSFPSRKIFYVKIYIFLIKFIVEIYLFSVSQIVTRKGELSGY